ncbi:MAG: minor capsid protein [Lachnospiraceae bacterium]
MGKRDLNKDCSITVYPTTPTAPIGTIGKESGYATKAISILVHWGKYTTPAELKATEVYNCFCNKDIKINGHRIIKCDMRTQEPVWLGADDNGICEYAINLVIYYNKKGM